MAAPAVADIGTTSNIHACGRAVKRKKVTISGSDLNTNSASILSIVAGQSVALVGSNSSLPASAATLIWGSKDSAGTVTEVARTKVASGVEFAKDLKSIIANNIASLPGETLVVQSDVAITLYLSLVQGDRIGVES